MSKSDGPKILFVDIETAPILAYVWRLFDENVGLNQIKADWHIISFSAKWKDDSKVIYFDQRNSANFEDDKALLQKIWKLLDEADIVIWQNGRNFDHKKLNARFILNGMQPPSSYKQIDTLEIAKKHFGFTSNKLEYMSDKLCTKYKKLTHKSFPGFEMWKECLAGNKNAWREMEKYNKHDVLALEELYNRLAPWDSSINFDTYKTEGAPETCAACGSDHIQSRGFYYTGVGKFRKYRCMGCGKEIKSRENLLSKTHKKSLKVPSPR